MNRVGEKELPIVVLGGGGHAKVLLELMRVQQQYEIIGISVPDKSDKSEDCLLGYPVVGGDDEVIQRYQPTDILLVNALGSTRQPLQRKLIYEKFKQKGYQFATLIHPSAIIASDVEIGEGAQIMAGAIVQPGCRIGENVIINTRASVDHDCVINDHVHLSPGVVLTGNVHVGETTHVGAGAIIIQGITIGEQSLVAAGAVVISDVRTRTTVMGIPAKEAQ